MKRILGLIVCGVLVLGITGCGNDENLNKDNNNSTTNNNEVGEQSKFYDEVIECLHDSKKSYIKAYLKNDNVVEVEYYMDQRTGNENISTSEFEQGLKLIKNKKQNQGFKNVEILEDGILMTITEEDTLWSDYNGTSEDVYKKIHDNTDVFSSFSCTTKK